MRRRSHRWSMPLLWIVVGMAEAPVAEAPPVVPEPAREVSYEDLVVTAAARTRDGRPEAGLRDTIEVTIPGLASWAQKNDAAKLVLHLAGHPVSCAHPLLVNARDDKLQFVLNPFQSAEGADAIDPWKAVLGRPTLSRRTVSVTVGLSDKLPVRSKVTGLHLSILPPFWTSLFAAGFVIVLILFVQLARRSDLLRDGPSRRGRERRPYSLGRTQMAVWFFLVAAAYIFIWMVAGARDGLTGSVLALIGISAGTALGSAVIDVSKTSDAKAKRDQLDADVQALRLAVVGLEQEVATPPAAATAVDIAKKKEELSQKKTLLGQKQGQIQDIDESLVPVTSGDFFKDILSDENGISFHRFQMAAWTVVFAVIFVASVYNVLSMPQFPDELLALTGISGGTYLGFKFPEKTT
jgi:hypothetical protein